MKLALFDLDNTLIAGDSDFLWGEFLVHKDLVDGKHHEAKNLHFYQQYQRGKMDIHAYLEFALLPLSQIDSEKLYALRAEFMQDVIAPIMLPKAQALVVKHQQAGDFCLIITATNNFITQPIAEKLAINTLIATEAEIIDGRYSGKISGIPCYQEGKVIRLRLWLNQQISPQGGSLFDLENSVFYSDSYSDIALLNLVSEAVAVDPDEKLRDHAQQQGWKIISLRN